MSQLQDFPAPAYDVERAKMNWVAGPCALAGGPDENDIAKQVEDSNWFVLIDMLQMAPENTYEVVQWDHWACNYVLGVFVAPGSVAEEICNEFADFLAGK